MSIKMMTWVWDHSPYRDDGLLIHLALADWADDEGICWPKQAMIAKKARCTVEHVRRVTKKMQQDGYLELVSVSRGPGSSHTYRLKYPSNSGVSKGKIPHIHERNTPHLPPNNHQEPPIEPSVERPTCVYCRKPVTEGKPHNCPAMNQVIR